MSKPLSKNSFLDKKLSSNFDFWFLKFLEGKSPHWLCILIIRNKWTFACVLKVWHSTGVPSLVGPQPMALAIGRFASPCTWQESHGPCFTTPSTHIRWGHKRVISPFSSSNLIEKSRTLYWKGTFPTLPPSWGHLMFFELAIWPSKVRFENSKN